VLHVYKFTEAGLMLYAITPVPLSQWNLTMQFPCALKHVSRNVCNGVLVSTSITACTMQLCLLLGCYYGCNRFDYVRVVIELSTDVE